LLLEKNIPFEYIEITDSISNLKEFLKLRDTMKGFQLAKRSHSVGVPALIIGDEVILNITDQVINKLEEMKEREINEK
jgi:glutaredoxin-related protein